MNILSIKQFNDTESNRRIWVSPCRCGSFADFW